MEHDNDSTGLLLKMLDNPQAYSEQQIRDIIGHDETTRQTYRLMVELKRSSRRQAARQADVDAAWRRFEASHLRRRRPLPLQVAASLAAVLLASGLAFAAVHLARRGSAGPAPTEQAGASPQTVAPADTTAQSHTAAAPRTFDNIALDEMLTEMAAHYGVEAVFQNDAARRLRFYFVWYREQPLDKVVETLNRFESVNIVVDNKRLIAR